MVRRSATAQRQHPNGAARLEQHHVHCNRPSFTMHFAGASPLSFARNRYVPKPLSPRRLDPKWLYSWMSIAAALTEFLSPSLSIFVHCYCIHDFKRKKKSLLDISYGCISHSTYFPSIRCSPVLFIYSLFINLFI